MSEQIELLEEQRERLSRVEAKLDKLTESINLLVRIEERTTLQAEEIRRLRSDIDQLRKTQSEIRGASRWSDWLIMALVGGLIGTAFFLIRSMG